MAKELPWFKFYADEWLTGHITLEDELLQGVFITVCAYYWKLDGNLNIHILKRRYRHIDNDIWRELIDKNFLKMSSENQISIKFLDKQIKNRKKQSKINSANGRRGGQAKANAKQTLSEKIPKAKRKPSNIDKDKDKEVDKDKDKEVDIDKDKEYTKEFLAFWDYYGKIGNKKSSSDNWNKLNPSQIEDIKTCIPAYILNTNTNGEYPSRKNAETYLNKDKEYWNDSIIFKNSGNNNNSIFESRI